EFVSYTPTITGTYKAHLAAEGVASGEYFLTRSTADTVGPRVITTSPGLNANVNTGSLTYVVTFNEPMNTAAVTTASFTLHGVFRNANPTPSTFTWNAAGTALTITYGALSDDAYTMTLTSGTTGATFRDAANNALDGEVTGALPSGNGTAGGNA